MVNNLSLFGKQRYALFHNPTNYSLFISFSRSIHYSFLRCSSKKRNKRSAAVCTTSAKNHSRFWEGRKTVASLTLRCGAFYAIISQSFHAAPVRSGFLTQHRFARCTLTAIHSSLFPAHSFRPHIWSVKKIRSVFGKEGRTAK